MRQTFSERRGSLSAVGAGKLESHISWRTWFTFFAGARHANAMTQDHLLNTLPRLPYGEFAASSSTMQFWTSVSHAPLSSDVDVGEGAWPTLVTELKAVWVAMGRIDVRNIPS
jgi:hypothetical protein